MSAPENPPAFPTIANVAHNSDWETDNGMTLRDYFAGQALAGLCANAAWKNAASWTSDPDTQSATAAYGYADAMLAERSK